MKKGLGLRFFGVVAIIIGVLLAGVLGLWWGIGGGLSRFITAVQMRPVPGGMTAWAIIRVGIGSVVVVGSVILCLVGFAMIMEDTL